MDEPTTARRQRAMTLTPAGCEATGGHTLGCIACGARADLEAEIVGLGERLRLAERVCALYGWSGTRAPREDHDKATEQAWMEWHHATPGMSDRRAWPELDDSGIGALARERDRIEQATLARIRTATS
jgi:hypothetical protein